MKGKVANINGMEKVGLLIDEVGVTLPLGLFNETSAMGGDLCKPPAALCSCCHGAAPAL